MRSKWRLLPIIASALVAFAGSPESAVGINSKQGAGRRGDAERPAVYVARVFSVNARGRDGFVSCLRRKELPVWRRLKRDGLLANQSVFETTSVRLSAPGVPAWNFLLLSRLAPAVTPDTLFEAEKRRRGRRSPGTSCEDAPGVEALRVEVLRSTPNSYHPSWAVGTTAPDAQAEFTVPYIIEYIAVHETPEALNEYRETMRTKIGPAVRQLIRDRQLLNLIALETVSVRQARPGVPEWNQIHLRGYFPDKGPVPPGALDGALRRIDPQGGGAAGVFGRLDAIRTKPREDVARQLLELAVR